MWSFSKSKILAIGTILVGLGIGVATTRESPTETQPFIEGAQETAENQKNDADACADACHLERAESITLESGTEAALEWAKNVSVDSIRIDCHGLYHRIGEVSAKSGWPKPYSNDCEYGYVHGVLRGRAEASDRALGSFVEEGEDYCAKLPQDEDQRQCAHGLGHAVALASPKSLKYALDICAKLENQLYMRQCVDGSLMEYAAEYQETTGWSKDPSGYMIQTEKISIRDEVVDYTSVCPVLPEGARLTCFSRIGMFMIPDLDKDMSLITKTCNKADDEIAKEFCHMSFSDHAIDKISRAEPRIPWPPTNAGEAETFADELIKACSEHPRGDWCIEGAVTVVGHLYTAKIFDNIPPICDKSPVSWRKACLVGLERALQLGQVEGPGADQ